MVEPGEAAWDAREIVRNGAACVPELESFPCDETYRSEAKPLREDRAEAVKINMIE
jgi:hypothetical protein